MDFSSFTTTDNSNQESEQPSALDENTIIMPPVKPHQPKRLQEEEEHEMDALLTMDQGDDHDPHCKEGNDNDGMIFVWNKNGTTTNGRQEEEQDENNNGNLPEIQSRNRGAVLLLAIIVMALLTYYLGVLVAVRSNDPETPGVRLNQGNHYHDTTTKSTIMTLTPNRRRQESPRLTHAIPKTRTTAVDVWETLGLTTNQEFEQLVANSAEQDDNGNQKLLLYAANPYLQNHHHPFMTRQETATATGKKMPNHNDIVGTTAQIPKNSTMTHSPTANSETLPESVVLDREMHFPQSLNDKHKNLLKDAPYLTAPVQKQRPGSWSKNEDFLPRGSNPGEKVTAAAKTTTASMSRTMISTTTTVKSPNPRTRSFTKKSTKGSKDSTRRDEKKYNQARRGLKSTKSTRGDNPYKTGYWYNYWGNYYNDPHKTPAPFHPKPNSKGTVIFYKGKGAVIPTPSPFRTLPPDCNVRRLQTGGGFDSCAPTSQPFPGPGQPTPAPFPGPGLPTPAPLPAPFAPAGPPGGPTSIVTEMPTILPTTTSMPTGPNGSGAPTGAPPSQTTTFAPTAPTTSQPTDFVQNPVSGAAPCTNNQECNNLALPEIGDFLCQQAVPCPSQEGICIENGLPLFTLAWRGEDDLDLQVITPGGFLISKEQRVDPVTGCALTLTTDPATDARFENQTRWAESVACPTDGSAVAGVYIFFTVVNRQADPTTPDTYSLSVSLLENVQTIFGASTNGTGSVGPLFNYTWTGEV